MQRLARCKELARAISFNCSHFFCFESTLNTNLNSCTSVSRRNYRFAHKVRARDAEIQTMTPRDFPFIHPRHPRYAALRALSQAIACIRKAQGKPCHTHFADGTPEYENAIEDYARDVIRAFCADPDLADF